MEQEKQQQGDTPVSLSTRDARTIFQALSEQPFKYVYELIGKLNATTNGAKPEKRNGIDYYEYRFTEPEFELMVHSLGKLPYERVYTVIEMLKRSCPTQTSREEA
nr:hypothetical protein [uncultured Desulfobacter sp.]